MGRRSLVFLANLVPAFRGTGARLVSIREDYLSIRVKIPLSWRTRNRVGTIFGGSLYAAVDPWHMIMLMRHLGKDYLVWDKSASIRFRRPGRATLWADCTIPDGELDEIRRLLETEEKIDRTYPVSIVDKDGVVHAEVENVVQIRRRRPT